MTSKKDIIHMAHEAGFSLYRDISAVDGSIAHLERFAELVAAAKREQVAAWMMQRGYATGHGDTTEDLLKELEWQVREFEREACAKVCEEQWGIDGTRTAQEFAAAIRARGQA